MKTDSPINKNVITPVTRCSLDWNPYGYFDKGFCENRDVIYVRFFGIIFWILGFFVFGDFW